MDNLIELFKILPNIGWGPAKEFTGTDENLSFMLSVMDGQGSMEIVAIRSVHLRDGGISDIDCWLNELAKGNVLFCSFMLKNYDFIEGSFVIPIDIHKMNEAAGEMMRIYKLK